MKHSLALLLVLLVSCGSTTGRHESAAPSAGAGDSVPHATGSASLNYHLAIADPASRDIGVSILVEDHNDSTVEFVMPTWSPDTLVRTDSAAHVSAVKARGRGGRTLRTTRVAANRWQVRAGGEDFVFSYNVHAVRGAPGASTVDDRGAVIRPASVCMFVEGRREQSAGVYVDVSESLRWGSHSGLATGSGPDRYVATDYAELIENPIVVGRLSEHALKLGENEARVLVAPAGTAASAQIANGIQNLLAQGATLLGAATQPQSPLFVITFNALQPGITAGTRSAVISVAGSVNERTVREALDQAAAAVALLHAGRALNVVDANRADFDRLPAHNMAWLRESFGTYFGQHLLQRIGLLTEDALLGRLAAVINRVESEPAKRLLSLASASESLAFLPRSRSWNGAGDRSRLYDARERGVAALLLLDLATIAASDGNSTLARLLEALRDRSGRLDRAAFALACEKAGGRGLGTLANSLMEDTGPRPYQSVAEETGFTIAAGGGSSSQLGAVLRGARVASVERGGAAARAGLQEGDRIVRFDGKNAGDKLTAKIAAYPAGRDTTVTVERRGSLVTLPIRLRELRRGAFRFYWSGGDTKTANRRAFFGLTETP